MTNIEWVKNPDGSQGISVNSKTGCLNHTPEGLCLGGLFPCYAWKLAHGRLFKRYLANHCLATGAVDPSDFYLKEADPFYPRFWPERLAAVRKIQKPIGIFLDDMSDWMGEYWPKEWTEMELQVMRDCPQHRFYTLTKQPQQLPQWSPFLENCWVGVTAMNPDMAWDATAWLQRVQGRTKYLSLEPLLDGGHPLRSREWQDILFSIVDWLIIGACTGTKKDMEELCQRYPKLTLMAWGKRWTAQPPIEWVTEIAEAADKARIRLFLKDNLKPLIPVGDSLLGDEDSEYKWQLRQEVPKYGTD